MSRRSLLALVVLLGSGGCERPVSPRVLEPPQVVPDPVPVPMSLRSVYGNPTNFLAILFELRGPRVKGLVPANAGIELFTEQIDSTRLRGIAIGEVAHGVVLYLQLTEAADADRYYPVLIAVSGRQNEPEASVKEYELSIGR